MAIKQFSLEGIDIEIHLAGDILLCILHMILFHRCLGPVTSKEVYNKDLKVTYVRCDDLKLEKIVNEQVDIFNKFIFENIQIRKHKIKLYFFEEIYKNIGPFKKKHKRYWEEWIINFRIVPSLNQITLQNNLIRQLGFIIQICNNNTDHLPPINTHDTISYSFEIELQDLNNLGMLQSFKDLIQTSSVGKIF